VPKAKAVKSRKQSPTKRKLTLINEKNMTMLKNNLPEDPKLRKKAPIIKREVS